MTLQLRVLTPEKTLLETQTDSVRLPGLDGSVGVMPGHRMMVMALAAGDVLYRKDGGHERVAIAGGLAQIDADSVTVLADAR